MKFGLRNIRALLKYVGHPERRFPSVHVAGTNGKGSTASFIASVVMEGGYKTGLYTSPHLLRFTERITINGKELSDDRLVYYVEGLRPAIETSGATFFEAATAVAFLYFADEAVDLAVVETGLGGRFDATNIVVPLVSVITNVSFDHMEHLGNTLPKIAREKGGIIKAGVPVVTGAEDRQVLSVFDRIARQKNATLYHIDRIARAARIPGRRAGAAVRLTSGFMGGRVVRPGLAGEHQVTNARLAIATCDLLLKEHKTRFPRISKAAVVRGIQRVRLNTGLHGRLERMNWRGKVILDVAHNPAGTETLVRALPHGEARPGVAVFGVMKDKDYGKMLETLSGTVPAIVAVAPKTGRALSARRLLRVAQKGGVRALFGGSVARGLQVARRIAGSSGTILVTGSHYVVAEALELMRKKRT